MPRFDESAVNQTENPVGSDAINAEGIAEAVKRAVGNKAMEWRDARPDEWGSRTVSNEERKRGSRRATEEELRRYTERHRCVIEKA